MRASTILRAYVESSRQVGGLAAGNRTTAGPLSEDRHSAARFKKWQRKSKQRARFLERLEKILAEYDDLRESVQSSLSPALALNARVVR